MSHTTRYVYTIDDGEGPWVSDPMTYDELSEGQQRLADCLVVPGEIVKLSSDRADITMEIAE